MEVKKILRQKAELERGEREAEEARAREAQEARRRTEEDSIRRQTQADEEQRLQSLRSQGEFVAALSGAPTEYKAAVTRDLATYVSIEQFPASLSSWQAHQYISARMNHVLKPWREQKAKEEQAAERRRQYEGLMSAGRSHASWKTSSWDSEDAASARREVDRALREEVGADWSRQDVMDLVEDVLEDWEQ